MVLTLVGHRFSDRADYSFHIDSGNRFGVTTAKSTIRCRFSAAQAVECSLDGADRAIGQASGEAGLQSRDRHMRVFAGLRSDPFFNNVRGTRSAYEAAAGTPTQTVDGAGCAILPAAQAARVLDRWRSTDGGPARNFLEGWTVSALVVSVDVDRVAGGGDLVGVWAATASGSKQVDRAGRPLTGNALLVTTGPADLRDAMKEQYNAASPATSDRFIAELEKGLAFYDGLDGACGDGWLSRQAATPALRYRPLAAMLADDRLWVNTRSVVCDRFLAVELHASGFPDVAGDCGGRTPVHDAANVYRSLLVSGAVDGIDDGLQQDEESHSLDDFPFLAQPRSWAEEPLVAPAVESAR